jgi:hypothetical protein
MQFLLVISIAFFGSGLTLFSGFGLGTILLPVFALFFPIEVAVALTAVVYFLNNLFKLTLFGKQADKTIVLKFGFTSIVASFLGAWLLSRLSHSIVSYHFSIGNHEFTSSPLKIIMGCTLIFFALFEIIPALSKLQIHPRYLPLGGLLSGFFGGLSGNQGALRSAFLMKSGLSKEVFIGTGVVIACLVDIARLSVYTPDLIKNGSELHLPILVAATLSAFAGAFIGSRVLKKITLSSVQTTVAVALIVFSVFLMVGIL